MAHEVLQAKVPPVLSPFFLAFRFEAEDQVIREQNYHYSLVILARSVSLTAQNEMAQLSSRFPMPHQYPTRDVEHSPSSKGSCMSSPSFHATPPYGGPQFAQTKPRSKTPLIVGIVLALLAVIAAFVFGFIIGSATSSTTAAGGASSDSGFSSSSESGAGTPENGGGNSSGGKGDPVASDGIVLTVTDVTEGPSIDYLERGVSAEAAATELLDATEGGKFVTVTTTVENTGTQAWDLTCGFAIQAELVDDQGRHFQPIDSLYRIPGNPECSDKTNPGFTETMKWSFEVPDAAKGFKLGFADPNINYDKLTYVELD